MFKKAAILLIVTSLLSCCMTTLANVNPTTPTKAPSLKQYFCPSAKELIKEELFWQAGTNWKSFTQSFAKEIGGFLGAQWIGVKIGKIICLYYGKEGMDFPIALEQVHSQLILEPKGTSWSTPISGRRICKSNNIFECPFAIEPEEVSKGIYEDIKYKEPQPQSELFRE
jgi:hypothetical protein